MNKTLIALSMIILVSLSFVGCQGTPSEPAQPGPVADEQFKVIPFAHQIKGDYNEELFNEQTKLQQEDKYYYTILQSEQELRDLVKKLNLVNDMGDMSLNYTEKFFEEHKMVAVFPQQGSSGVNYAVTSISPTDTLIDIVLEQYIPEVATTDIVNKGFLIGIEKEELLGKDNQDKNIHITMRTVQAVTGMDKNDLSMDDLALGNLKLMMTAAYVDRIMNTTPISVETTSEGEIEPVVVEKRKYEDLEAVIRENELVYLSTTSDHYATPRGLKVGDHADVLLERYGEPSQIAEDEKAKTKIYSFDLSGEYFFFHAEIKEDEIIRLQVNLAD